MEIKYYKKGCVPEEKIKIVVIFARIKEMWIFVRNKERLTWETPAGHRETDEDAFCAAKRELFEESGALEYSLKEGKRQTHSDVSYIKSGSSMPSKSQRALLSITL